MNNITIVGRLTCDPELKTDRSGKERCHFTVADNISKDEANFFDCIANGQTGENICRYFRKGNFIAVVGKMRILPYKTKHDDSAKAMRVYVNAYSFCENKPQSSDSAEPDLSYPEDDLPF